MWHNIKKTLPPVDPAKAWAWGTQKSVCVQAITLDGGNPRPGRYALTDGRLYFCEEGQKGTRVYEADLFPLWAMEGKNEKMD